MASEKQHKRGEKKKKQSAGIGIFDVVLRSWPVWRVVCPSVSSTGKEQRCAALKWPCALQVSLHRVVNEASV